MKEWIRQHLGQVGKYRRGEGAIARSLRNPGKAPRRIVSLKMIVIGVGTATISGCGLSPTKVTMASGQNNSGYQRISEQVGRSVERIGDLRLQDGNDSRGSQDNLQRVLDGDVTFALVQLDVARPAMRKGKIQTLAILAKEHFHLITRSDRNLDTILDLQGKPVAVGQDGSGTFFTAQRLLNLAGLKVQPRQLSFSQGLKALEAGEVEAIAYVGTIGVNRTVRDAMENSDPPLKLLSVPPAFANYITANYPESYHQTTIPEGIYNPIRTRPPEDIPAIATGTALIAKSNADHRAIGLMTWAILSTARQYAVFYPELADGDPKELLQRNSLYTAIAAQKVYAKGDPRNAWLRSIQENETIQEYALALIVTSAIGLLLGWWQRRKSSKVMQSAKEAVAQLRSTLEQDPQTAANGITQMTQKYRLMSLDGAISADAYEQVSRMFELLDEQARAVLENLRQQKIGDTVSLLDAVDTHFQESPEQRRAAMVDIDRQYRAMLQSGEVDLSTYLQLRQLGILQLGLHGGDTSGDTSKEISPGNGANSAEEGEKSSPPRPSKQAAKNGIKKRLLPKPTPVMPPPRRPIPFPPSEPPKTDSEP
ncbi:MAG: TAXI family TRAP transporter solute-binding subunit [Cyanobacteria bacterium P01_D01_bin.73]